MKTYYGFERFMQDMEKRADKPLFDIVKGVQTKRDELAFQGGKTSTRFFKSLDGSKGYEKTRSETLQILRHVVKDAGYTLVFEHDHFSLTKTQHGMHSTVSAPVKVLDTVTRLLLINTFIQIGTLFEFPPATKGMRSRWKEVEGYRVDLGFGDIELCVEIGGPKYHEAEITWAQVEKSDYTMALTATMVASVENIIDNFVDFMINRTKDHFENHG